MSPVFEKENVAARIINVLYVEDDEADVEFVQSALDELDRADVKIQVVEDGEEALKFFSKDEKYEGRESPNLILLDLNLPKVGGKQVLRHLKNSADLKKIPVIVLTTSSVQDDVDETYGLGASGYITKPSNFNGYKETVRRICDYWTETCALPTRPSKNLL